jgi:pimeloyl-ACP methyl ester carboxylesterase
MPSQRVVTANGIRIHLVEQGEGPLVLFVHGFPESWYSWRHQLAAVAEAGFRGVAIDVRGYGRSSKPLAIDEYRMVKHVADNVGVVEALGESRAVIVGHDWGAPIACTSALLRPDMFHALVHASVPYSPRGLHRPTEVFAMLGGSEEFYISYFQQPGRAEAEIESDAAGWLRGFYFTASGDAPTPEPGKTMGTVPLGGTLRQRLVQPEVMPAWMSEEDLAFYVSEFEHGGFSGPLNRYRNVDRDWEDLAGFTGRPIQVPALFIGGDRDGPTLLGSRAISRFGSTLPLLAGSHILEGCGHWTQQERPQEFNRLLVEFLRSLG